ncbi:MAG: APC family permease [Rothia sp. (in: high G+C Gram-positive bacteria)]|uniref:APC family permease n=1 Tax=Rothia sp. (in: high G+C Gram-positive bacteria) TaxID=1885016 RepID=UPI002701208D|nr:APC family permease [Rothia sp. (in: high G+C Gram-positive bacteria)]
MTNQTTLQRSLKPSWVFAMALGSAVGWGAFILPFTWATTGGLLGTFIGFLIGGAMISIIAVSYGYAIEKLPVTGGGVAYALASLGRLHGFIAGWALTLGYSGIVALNASAVTLVFRVTLPEFIMQWKLYSVAGWDIYLPEVLIATLFIVGFAVLNASGAAISGRFQYFAVLTMLVSVGIILVCSLYYLIIDQPVLPPAFPENVAPWSAIATIVAFAPWAYVGFDTVPQLAGEFKFSPKKAFSLLMWGVIAATAIYLAMMLSVSVAVSSERDSYAELAWPTATAIADMMGKGGFILMVIAVSMGVLTGLNGFYASSSRVLYTMSNAGMIPRIFGRLHPTFKTPVYGIAFVAALCLITPWFGRSALLWIVDMTSVGIAIVYFYVCFCAYKIAKQGKVFGMSSEVTPSPAHKVIAVLGCMFSLGFLCLLLVPGSPGQLTAPSFIALVFWVVLGVVFYLSLRSSYLERTDEQILEAVFNENTSHS